MHTLAGLFIVMKYQKTAKTYEEQADLLISRKMAGVRSSIIEKLSTVNYYRLSGYWHPFQDQATGDFRSGTTFDMIWDRYVFDRQLRLLTLDAIERIEVYLRSGLANALAMEDAASLGVHDKVLCSWIEVLNIIRNMAAHHGRLWNRTMGIRPKIPQKDSAWHAPVEIGNDRMFGVLSICRYCLRRIAPQSQWQTRLEDLFGNSPSIPIQKLGFPANWKSSPIWQ